MRVAFRVDVSVEMGIGHLMRCITLANAIRQTGAQILFICDDCLGVASDYLPASEFIQLDLTEPINHRETKDEPEHAQWIRLGWKEDAKQTRKLLMQWKADWLVVDHYGIDHRWHQKQKETILRILVIDDLADRKYDCDLLLDQTFGRQSEAYFDFVPDRCRLLLGGLYALLRPEFSELRVKALEKRKTQNGIQNILIFMGGTDNKNLTEVALRSVEGAIWSNRPKVSIVLSKKAPYLKIIQKIADQSSHLVKVHVDSKNMAALILTADLAIGAGGTASWERCAMGLPTLITAFSKNQQVIANTLENKGAAMRWKGEHELCEILKIVNEKPKLLTNMTKKAFGICDGRGCGLVLKQMNLA